MKQLKQCPYCLKHKTPKDFNKEHVVHKAASAGFENNLTVKICKDCNDLFAITIDSEMGNDSFEAYKRSALGGKNPSSLLKGNLSKRLRVKTKETDGTYTFLPVKPSGDALDPAVARSELRLVAKNSIETVSVSADELLAMSRDELMEKYDFSKPIKITGLTSEAATLKEQLERKLGTPGSQVQNKKLEAQLEYTVDGDIQRSAAKVAFNYLIARCGATNKELPFSADFDELRKFVMEGKEPATGRPVNPLLFPQERNKDHPLLKEDGYVAMLEYGIDISTGKRCLIAKIKLSIDYCYMVTLAREATETRADIEGAHVWVLSSKKIIFLDATQIDKLRGM